jgi:thiosulfate/3-mercaptopyruvate sulfurtransferase
MFAALFVSLAIAATPHAYPNPSLLLQPGDLAKASGDYRLLDVRSRDAFEKGHAPGAIWVDVAAWSKAFNADPDDATGWSKRLGGYGIDADKSIVVMGDALNESARVWWLLRYWGCSDVKLVDGGWTGYVDAGGPVTIVQAKPRQTTPNLTAHHERLETKGQLLDALKGKPPQIVDARSTAEYCGTKETAARNGSIPGAINLEWTEVLDPKTKRFKSPADLKALIAERHIDVDRPVVTYCQSGGRAAAVAFTLELMGGKQVGNYYKSWAEWGNAADTPVVKPPKNR